MNRPRFILFAALLCCAGVSATPAWAQSNSSLRLAQQMPDVSSSDAAVDGDKGTGEIAKKLQNQVGDLAGTSKNRASERRSNEIQGCGTIGEVW